MLPPDCDLQAVETVFWWSLNPKSQHWVKKGPKGKMKTICLFLLLLFAACSKPVVADAPITSTDGHRPDPIEKIVQAHLEKMYPRQSFTVDTIQWTIDELQCVTSTLHAHYSGLKHWLIDKNTRLMRDETPAAVIFTEQKFVEGAVRHPAKTWALLALCAQRASGHLVDRASLAAWRDHLHVDETVEPPRIEPGANGPVLRFWSYTTYQSLPTLYMHRLYLDENGTLVTVESRGVTPDRKNRIRESNVSP